MIIVVKRPTDVWGQRTHRQANCANITCNSFEKVHICRAAGDTAACTPCHFHQQLQLLCFPGLSWCLHGNPLRAETGKSASLRPPVVRRRPQRFLRAEAASERLNRSGNAAFIPFLLRQNASTRSCAFTSKRRFPFFPSTSKALVLNVWQRKDAGRGVTGVQ